MRSRSRDRGCVAVLYSPPRSVDAPTCRLAGATRVKSVLNAAVVIARFSVARAPGTARSALRAGRHELCTAAGGCRRAQGECGRSPAGRRILRCLGRRRSELCTPDDFDSPCLNNPVLLLTKAEPCVLVLTHRKETLCGRKYFHTKSSFAHSIFIKSERLENKRRFTLSLHFLVTVLVLEHIQHRHQTHQR